MCNIGVDGRMVGDNEIGNERWQSMTRG